MKKITVDCATGEVSEVAQYAAKDAENKVRLFEVGEGLPSGFTQISDAEALEITSKPTQERINADARAYLNKTGWYVERFAETGVPIPPEISAARQAARESVKP